MASRNTGLIQVLFFFTLKLMNQLPYPWTEATLKTAENIINMLDELTPEQKKQLVDFIPDIIVETPQSRYAALVYAKFLDGLQGLAVDCFKDWLKKNVLPTLLVLMNMQEQ